MSIIFTKKKILECSLLKVSDSVFGLKQPTRACKHFEANFFYGCPWVIVMDQDGLEGQFDTNYHPKTHQKPQKLTHLLTDTGKV